MSSSKQDLSADGALFARYFRAHAPRLGAYTILAAAQSLFILPALYLLHYVIDVAIPQSNMWGLIYAGLGIILSRGLSSVCAVLTRVQVVRLIKTAIANIRNDLIAQLYRLSPEYHATAEISRIQTRIIQDTERLDTASSGVFSGILPATLSAIIILLALIVIQWQLVLVLILLFPAIWFLSKLAARNVRESLQAFRLAFEDFTHGVLFVLRQMDLTRVRVYEEAEQAQQAARIERLRLTSERMARSFTIQGHINQNLTGIVGVALLVVGAMNVSRGAMTMGELLAFYAAAGLLNGSINTVLNGFADFVSGSEALRALRSLFEAGPVDLYRGTRTLSRFSGHIALSKVAFHYDRNSVLSNVSLQLRPDSFLAIVGDNGSGKSTILNVILGFAQPQSGLVTADGVSYDELDLRALRRNFGVVRQQSSCFRGTVLENIAYGRPDASFEKIQASAKLAGAHDFISTLPDGYQTSVGERGHLLSGGECQRIAIARALVGDPKFLILDEPTNHLDQESLQTLISTLRSLPNRPGILLVSHDARVVECADEVWRLSDGVLTLASHPGQSRAIR